MLIYLLCSYILTAVILMVLALLLYKLRLTEKVVSVVIIITYISASFLGGFLAGRKGKKRRYLWGLVMGVMYYTVFIILSLVIKGADVEISKTILTTLVLCCGGGMLGGMLS